MSCSLLSTIFVDQGCCKPLHIQLVLSFFDHQWFQQKMPSGHLMKHLHQEVVINTPQKFPGLFVPSHFTHSAAVQVAEFPHEYQVLQLWGFFLLSKDFIYFLFYIRHSRYPSWHHFCLSVLWPLSINSWLSHDLSQGKAPCIPDIPLNHTLPLFLPS